MMGCTSSAPNVPEIAAHTTEPTEIDNTDITDDLKENEDSTHGTVANDLKDATVSEVLPTCDSLEENIQLARNNESFIKSDNELDQDRDQLTSGVENENIESEDQSEHEKKHLLITLKEVADQAILNNIFEDSEQTPILHREISNSNVENVVSDTEDKSTELTEEFNDEGLDDTEDQDNLEESASPSQSDSNRSTRWEALADIAAELPPSLAVDPITGQIYSLTK